MIMTAITVSPQKMTGLGSDVGHNRPLTLPEPEPTLPFDLPLSEPTYRHRPNLTAFLSPIFC